MRVPKARPTTAKAKETAQERREKKRLEEIAERQRQEHEALEFAERRPDVFRRLLFKAMRLELLVQRYPRVREDQQWWFSCFSVDAQTQTFRCETMSGSEVTQDNLRLQDVGYIERDLDMGLGFVDEYVNEQERKRREAEELQRKREAALAKLSAEDRKVLGLP